MHRRHATDLFVIDTLTTFLPGRNEAVAGALMESLLPLRRLTAQGMCVLLLHHPAKGDPLPGQAARLVRVDEDGATFTSHIDGSRQRLTPESSIAIQEALGADIILAFDEPTSPLHEADYTRAAMERTHRWAKRCLAARQRSDQALYGIVQGGAFEELRTASARFIGGMPFDGVAIGGSLGKSKADMHAVIGWSTRPDTLSRHRISR